MTFQIIMHTINVVGAVMVTHLFHYPPHHHHLTTLKPLPGCRLAGPPRDYARFFKCPL